MGQERCSDIGKVRSRSLYGEAGASHRIRDQTGEGHHPDNWRHHWQCKPQQYKCWANFLGAVDDQHIPQISKSPMVCNDAPGTEPWVFFPNNTYSRSQVVVAVQFKRGFHPREETLCQLALERGYEIAGGSLSVTFREELSLIHI